MGRTAGLRGQTHSQLGSVALGLVRILDVSERMRSSALLAGVLVLSLGIVTWESSYGVAALSVWPQPRSVKPLAPPSRGSVLRVGALGRCTWYILGWERMAARAECGVHECVGLELGF